MADTGVTWIYYHPASSSEVSLSIAASAAAWRVRALTPLTTGQRWRLVGSGGGWRFLSS
jgi:hypothetical protein